MAAVQRELEWPAFQPPVSFGRVGQDNVLWLRREGRAAEQHEWVLIEPDGNPLGRLFLDGGTTVLWSDRDEVWASFRDEFDVPWLVKYHLQGLR